MRAPEFWNHDGGLARLLAPLGFFQAASVAWKARHARPFRPQAKVICVGNLTAGGSGKTPLAITLAQALKARGKNPVFLTRGYGGQLKGPHRVDPQDDVRSVGDEALLLARVAPAIVARDRRAGAKLADSLSADFILMDDGHQNFALVKDLSIVVVDGENGFGNGLVLPAGPLREPVARGLARADVVVVIGSEARSTEGKRTAKHSQEENPALHGFHGQVLRAQIAASAPELEGRRVFAFAGIGRPEKFSASLRTSGATIAGTRFFGDHHFYRAHEIARLKADAVDALLVTTDKDFVRLGPFEAERIAVLKVAAAFADPHALTALLDRLELAV